MTGPHASGGDATRAGLTAVVPFIAPGMTERALQIEIEAERDANISGVRRFQCGTG